MTAYKDVPINLVGGDYQSRSKMWNSQKCINLYVETQASGRTPTALLCWPGETLFSEIGSSTSRPRGSFMHKDRPHFIMGSSVVDLNESGVSSTLTSGLPGNGRVAVASDGFNVVYRLEGSITYTKNNFILGGKGLTFVERGTGALQTASLPNMLTDNAVARFTIVGDAPVVVFDEDTKQVSGESDPVRQVFAFQNKIYVGGSRSMEIYYLTGDADAPLLPYEGALSNSVGVASEFSMANSLNYLYFLGTDNSIYRMSSSQMENVTPSAVASTIRGVDTSEAYGTCVSMEGQHFYILQMINSNLTLVYSETTGQFTRIQTGLTSAPHLMYGYVFAYNKHLITDYRSNKVFEWDFENYTSDGNSILRQIDTAPINGIPLEIFGDSLIFGYMDIKLEAGVGNSDFPDPVLEIEYSLDGGRTFKPAQPVRLQREGNSLYRARWNDCFTFYELVVRLRVTEGVFTGFHSGSIGVQKGGY